VNFADLKADVKAALNKPEPLFLLGYMLFPLLALVFAALGLWMIISGQKIPGLIVLLVVTQAFTFGALWAIGRRRHIVANPPGDDAEK